MAYSQIRLVEVMRRRLFFGEDLPRRPHFILCITSFSVPSGVQFLQIKHILERGRGAIREKGLGAKNL